MVLGSVRSCCYFFRNTSVPPEKWSTLLVLCVGVWWSETGMHYPPNTSITKVEMRHGWTFVMQFRLLPPLLQWQQQAQNLHKNSSRGQRKSTSSLARDLLQKTVYTHHVHVSRSNLATVHLGGAIAGHFSHISYQSNM